MSTTFLLSKTAARVSAPNLRRELHGTEDRVTGVDIDFCVDVSTNVLDGLTNGLKIKWGEFLYDNEGYLRCPELGPIKIRQTLENHDVTLNHRADDNKAMEFSGVTLKKFSFSPKTNGLIELKGQIQLHPSDDQLHYLADGVTVEVWQIEIKGSSQTDAFDEQTA